MKTADSAIVYLDDGREAEIVAALKDGSGYVVAPRLRYDPEDLDPDWDGCLDEDGWLSEALEKVSRVHSVPPVDAYVAEVAGLRREIDEERDRLAAIRTEIGSAMEERRGLARKLADVPGLKHLDDFLEGKMTHFAVLGFGAFKVLTKDAFLREEGRRIEFRALSLFGDVEAGAVRWMRNQYKDGSGSWTECVPCLSWDEARTVVAERLRDLFAAPVGNNSRCNQWCLAIPPAKEFAVEIPEHVLDHVAAERTKEAEREVETAQAQLDVAMTKLRAAKGGAE